MRVLFVQEDLEVENLGIMYIASMLRRVGHDVSAIEANEERILERLADGQPTIVAYSALAFYGEHYIELNRRLKQKAHFFSVFGGHFPTGYPEMIRREGVDAVCLGEGEYPFLELAERLGSGGDIYAIRNFWFKKGTDILKNECRPLIEDLDALPFPDRTLFKRRAPFFQDRVSMVTGRGCAYRCPYCYNNALLKIYPDRAHTHRRRSVANVLEEIREIRSLMPVRFILFHDDVFTLMPEWLREFSDLYAREFHIPFSCNVRIDALDEATIKRLRHAGCHSVSFGIESGNDRVRKDLLKRSMDKEAMIAMSRCIKEHGIRVRTTNIIGATDDLLDTDLETVKLNIDCGVDLAKVGILSAYPSTDIDPANELNGEKWGEFSSRRVPLAARCLNILSHNAAQNFVRERCMAQRQSQGRSRQRQKRFQRLFPIVVGFPFLLPAVKLLVRLPLGFFYEILAFCWDNYGTYGRIYPTGIRSFFKGFLAYYRGTSVTSRGKL